MPQSHGLHRENKILRFDAFLWAMPVHLNCERKCVALHRFAMQRCTALHFHRSDAPRFAAQRSRCNASLIARGKAPLNASLISHRFAACAIICGAHGACARAAHSCCAMHHSNNAVTICTVWWWWDDKNDKFEWTKTITSPWLCALIHTMQSYNIERKSACIIRFHHSAVVLPCQLLSLVIVGLKPSLKWARGCAFMTWACSTALPMCTS